MPATLTPTTIRDALSSATGREVVRDAMPVLKVVAVGGVREHFQTATGPDGLPWKKLRHERPDGGSGLPLSDKGLLAASVSASTTEDEITLRASHPAANVHQYGATIRPTRARALTLPLTPEAKRVGSPGRNRFPRPLFVLSLDNQRGFLAERTPEGGMVLHYVLRKMVVVPARPFLGYSAKTLDRMTKILADRYARRVASALGG